MKGQTSQWTKRRLCPGRARGRLVQTRGGAGAGIRRVNQRPAERRKRGGQRGLTCERSRFRCSHPRKSYFQQCPSGWKGTPTPWKVPPAPPLCPGPFRLPRPEEAPTGEGLCRDRSQPRWPPPAGPSPSPCCAERCSAARPASRGPRVAAMRHGGLPVSLRSVTEEEGQTQVPARELRPRGQMRGPGRAVAARLGGPLPGGSEPPFQACWVL